MAGEGERLLELLMVPEVAEALSGGTPWRRCPVKRVRRLAAAGEIQKVTLGSLTRYSAEPVTVDIITTPGGSRALASLERKSAQADEMFTALVKHMGDALSVARSATYDRKVEVPAWVTP